MNNLPKHWNPMPKISFSGAPSASDNMYHGKHYAFYHHPVSLTDAPLKYQELVKSATRSVEIWDPWFNDSDTAMFKCLNNNVKTKLLTFQEKRLFQKKFNEQWKLSTVIQLSGKSAVSVKFACIDKGNNTYNAWEWHDRWLIIDSERVFLVGSSLSNYLAPNHTTGIYELSEEEDMELVKQMFEKYWDTAVKGCKLMEEVIV